MPVRCKRGATCSPETYLFDARPPRLHHPLMSGILSAPHQDVLFMDVEGQIAVIPLVSLENFMLYSYGED